VERYAVRKRGTAALRVEVAEAKEAQFASKPRSSAMEDTSSARDAAYIGAGMLRAPGIPDGSWSPKR
jgi:hypothetical protein